MSPEKSYRHEELTQERGYMYCRRQSWKNGATEDLWKLGFCPVVLQYCFSPIFPCYAPILPFVTGKVFSVPLYIGSINLFFLLYSGSELKRVP